MAAADLFALGCCQKTTHPTATRLSAPLYTALHNNPATTHLTALTPYYDTDNYTDKNKANQQESDWLY
jgi:hypothetical protein